jgi:hypothetical protein
MNLEALASHLELPDLWQQEAVRSLKAGQDVVLGAPTGAGKTFVFELLVKSGALRGQAVYTVPTRALANDKWRTWKAAGWRVGIATGDLAVDTDAPVVVATLETQRERFLSGDGPRLLVIDEYQMIGDARRGLNYELAIVLSPPSTQLLLMSGSVANGHDIAAWMRGLGRDVVHVEHRERPVPLEDIPVQSLTRAAPNSIKGFWPRVAVSVLMSDCAPLLIFAPQRKAAEKIARQISAALPQGKPVPLSAAQEAALGPQLSKMIRNRVAYHHSGLTFAQRAGIIEPLAKSGQLRVIVATTGLAAGINFSVRSVLVSDTQYQDGLFQRELTPDELLQMYGRAGRRGLDEVGYALCIENGPRLSDARPKTLRRANRVDWPTLLRVMEAAGRRGDSPFQAAAELTERLFSPRAIGLGFTAGDDPAPDNGLPLSGQTLFGIDPGYREIRNAAEEWERESPDAVGTVQLREALAWTGKRGWQPALRTGAYMQELARPIGRLCKIPESDGSIYGAEIQLAKLDEAGKAWLTKRWRSVAPPRRRLEAFDPADLIPWVTDAVQGLAPGAALRDLTVRDGFLHAIVDLGALKVQACRDRSGAWLIDPERRSVRVRFATGYLNEASGESMQPQPGSAAHAWRQLGLIEANGRPTLRGLIFSYFHQGEGLAIAAALEDETYPVKDIITHLVNLRAGYRFESDARQDTPSERLGLACRQAYGTAEFPGYLRLGVPPTYGEGAAEVVEAFLAGRHRDRDEEQAEFGRGDIERALTEWLSLLRHIAHAPDAPWPRWNELRQAASTVAHGHQPRQKSMLQLPEFESHFLRQPVLHRLGRI